MFSDRNITLVILARLVSRVGGSAAFFIGTWGTAAYSFHASATQLAGMSAANAVAGILGTMVAGVLIDRIGPRRVLIGAEVLTIPAVIAMSQARTFPVFVMCSVLFAIAGVPTFTAGASFAPFLVSGREQLERVNSYIEAAGSAGFVLGPAIGAVISKLFGLPYVFLLMAVSSVIAATLATMIRIEEKPAEKRQPKHPLEELRAGLRVSYTLRSLRYFILLNTLVWLGFGSFSALEPLFYRDVVGVGVEWIGYMNTFFGSGIIIGAWLLPRLPDRVVSARGALVGTVLAGLGASLYVGSSNLWLIMAGSIAWGLIIGGLEPLMRTLIHLDTPHEYVGRVMSTVQYHRNAAELVPLAFAPALAAMVGVQPVLMGGGVIVALLAAATWFEAVSIERLARKATEAIADGDAVARVEAPESFVDENEAVADCS